MIGGRRCEERPHARLGASLGNLVFHVEYVCLADSPSFLFHVHVLILEAYEIVFTTTNG